MINNDKTNYSMIISYILVITVFVVSLILSTNYHNTIKVYASKQYEIENLVNDKISFDNIELLNTNSNDTEAILIDGTNNF